MNKIVIVSDSTCDLSKELIEENNVRILPLHVTFKGDDCDYLDGVSISSEEVYKKVDVSGNTPVTGAINVNEFIELFKEIVDNGDDLIYIGLGSKISSTFNNSLLARSEVSEEHIECVDSMNLSTGEGLLVLKAAKFIKEGLNVHEVAEKLRILVPKVSDKFCIDTLVYLNKGGRCSSLTKLVGQLFKIHPIIKLIDGELKVYRMPRGKYIKAVDEEINEFKKDLENIDKDAIFITHSPRMEGEDKYIFDELKKYVDPSILHITEAGCVISSHCGPKTVGILYILKD